MRTATPEPIPARPVLSLSLAGVAAWEASPREQLEAAALMGFGAVHLNGAAPGTRARDLDRSARRDLAALLRRLGLEPSGVDLWIPPEHLVDPARQERAMHALLGAIELAADVGELAGDRPRSAVSTVLPADLPADARATLIARADACGVVVADHAWPRPESSDDTWIRAGLDPAHLLLTGADVLSAAARLGPALGSARLSDAGPFGRVAPGTGAGRLDVDAYAVTLLATGYRRAVVLDLRMVPGPIDAARAVATGWGARTTA